MPELQKKIHKLVYELYGLMEGEIEVVENAEVKLILKKLSTSEDKFLFCTSLFAYLGSQTGCKAGIIACLPSAVKQE